MPAKRVLISIDERLLARIDDAVRRRGMTRSGFLAQAAAAQIDDGHPDATNGNGTEGAADERRRPDLG